MKQLKLTLVNFIIVTKFILFTFSQRATRIIGGELALPGEFPYMVSLQGAFQIPFITIPSHHVCGGSLITTSWVLTAAHCKLLLSFYVKNEVLAGEGDLNNIESKTKQVRLIQIFIKYTRFPSDKIDGFTDIAMAKVDDPFILNDFVNVINLPIADSIPSGSGIICGFGATSTTLFAPYSTQLKKATVPLLPIEECVALYNDIFTLVDNTNVCAGDERNKITGCTGDSGSPLIQTISNVATLVGVTSFGSTPCGPPYYHGVYYRVSFYIDWIIHLISA